MQHTGGRVGGAVIVGVDVTVLGHHNGHVHGGGHRRSRAHRETQRSALGRFRGARGDSHRRHRRDRGAGADMSAKNDDGPIGVAVGHDRPGAHLVLYAVVQAGNLRGRAGGEQAGPVGRPGCLPGAAPLQLGLLHERAATPRVLPGDRQGPVAGHDTGDVRFGGVAVDEHERQARSSPASQPESRRDTARRPQSEFNRLRQLIDVVVCPKEDHPHRRHISQTVAGQAERRRIGVRARARTEMRSAITKRFPKLKRRQGAQIDARLQAEVPARRDRLIGHDTHLQLQPIVLQVLHRARPQDRLGIPRGPEHHGRGTVIAHCRRRGCRAGCDRVLPAIGREHCHRHPHIVRPRRADGLHSHHYLRLPRRHHHCALTLLIRQQHPRTRLGGPVTIAIHIPVLAHRHPHPQTAVKEADEGVGET